MGIADEMASKQKQIAISEFFEKNKHFLGFDTLQRAIITAVKEAVDNALDACEEARILPTITVQLEKVPGRTDELILTVQDNGPGLPQTAIEHVFGKLLYGSRFHAIRQSRGQQGIGITGVVLYSQLTTGETTHVISKVASEATAVEVDIGIDTKRNKARKQNQDRTVWLDEDGESVAHGLRIQTRMKAKYQRGRQSVHSYLRMSSIVNPHADITFIDLDGERHSWPRATTTLPRPVREIKPHPAGIHLGMLQRLTRDAQERRMTTFLRQTFSGVSMRNARVVLEKAGIEESFNPSRLKDDQLRSLIEAFNSVKLLSPPTDCLSPIEHLLIKKGLSKTIDSRFAATVTRSPAVSAGNPFQVEVGLVFGGDIAPEGSVEVLRFANRVPLLYQQGGCLLAKVIEAVDWRKYGLDQKGGRGLPGGPAAVLVHLASTNVQFTSEAKEAVADNEEVFNELRLALLECGRQLRTHLKKEERMAKVKEKFELINVILPEIAAKASSLLSEAMPDLDQVITKITNAVICEETTTWDARERLTRIHILIHNYTARPRSYTILVRWPEAEGATFAANERGGHKEMDGLWAWKLETLAPGERAEIRLDLAGLEKGEWKETDVFYRGAGEIIGAMVLDEDLLADLRRDAEAMAGSEASVSNGGEDEDEDDEDGFDDDGFDDDDNGGDEPSGGSVAQLAIRARELGSVTATAAPSPPLDVADEDVDVDTDDKPLTEDEDDEDGFDDDDNGGDEPSGGSVAQLATRARELGSVTATAAPSPPLDVADEDVDVDTDDKPLTEDEDDADDDDLTETTAAVDIHKQASLSDW